MRRSNAYNRRQVPLDVQHVIYHVGKRIESNFGRWIEFAIAGSYPSAVKAYEDDPTVLLEYNDIDVFLAHQGQSGRRTSAPSGWTDELYDEGAIARLVDITYEKGVIPGSNVEVNLITLKPESPYSNELSLQGLIDSFDINAVMVGFTASCSAIHRWHLAPEFERFLGNKKLEIESIQRLARPVSAFIRLLYKAQQLRLPCKLPEERILLDSLDGRCMGEPTKKKFDKLTPRYKEQVTSRFRITGRFFASGPNCFLYKLERRRLIQHEVSRDDDGIGGLVRQFDAQTFTT